MDLAGNLIGSIGAIIIFIGIISFCCSSDTNSSTGSTQKTLKEHKYLPITMMIHTANALPAVHHTMTTTVRNADTPTSIRDGSVKTISG